MIISQKPTVGLYICIREDNITTKEHLNDNLIVGTPLRYIQADESAYLFSDAAGNVWRMTKGQFGHCVRKNTEPSAEPYRTNAAVVL